VRSRIEKGRTMRLLRQSQVRASTKLVWIWMTGGYEVAVHDTIGFNVTEAAQRMGMSRHTVWRALHQLEDLGHIIWTPHQGNRPYPQNLGNVTICREPRRRP
jgi:Homeodomain-like domain-containing protein